MLMHMPMCMIGGEMPASERVVVLMSPHEKQELDAKAARAGSISAGELVRRAVAAYDADADAEASELRGLLKTFAGVHAQTLLKLEATERKLDDTLAYLRRGGAAS